MERNGGVFVNCKNLDQTLEKFFGILSEIELEYM